MVATNCKKLLHVPLIGHVCKYNYRQKVIRLDVKLNNFKNFFFTFLPNYLQNIFIDKFTKNKNYVINLHQ